MTGTRVLIVDDMAQVRQDLHTALLVAAESAGASIAIAGEAANGKEALEQMREHMPDAVLMDLEMPVMDGYSAANQIKERYPSIRVVALTVHDNLADREKALQAGMDEVIIKGAPLAEIIRSITEPAVKRGKQS
jgi:DNA-binding NarL/FixJ family response regulator